MQYTPPTGKWVKYGYDAAHRLTSITNSANQSLVYELDAAGNVVRENRHGSTGNLLSYEQRQFDALGRLAHVLGNHGQINDFTYDAQGNPTGSTDARARHTQTDYDPLGRTARITDPAGGLTQFAYDADDRLTQVIDPLGLTTQYHYNGLGQLLDQTSPDTGSTRFEHDAAGNRIRAIDARGVETLYTYDALNRLTRRHYPADATHDVLFTYDQGTNGKGHLATLVDESGSTTFSYHRRGLLIGQNSDGINVRYGYNASDNLSSITYPSGRVVQYGRGGPREAITQITLNIQGVAISLLSGIAHRADGPISTWTYGNGLILKRSYDTDARLIKQTLGGLQSVAWNYNDVDQILAWTDVLNSARTQHFNYDALDRLTSSTGPYATQTFSYDANGNRLREQSGSSLTTYAYVPGSQRLSSRSGSVNETRGYDAAGNPTSVRGFSTTYNVSGRLAQAGSAEYRYNGFGQRVYKHVNGVVIRYVYDPAGHLLAEVDASGQTTREYVWLDEQPIAVLTPQSPDAATVRIDYLVPDHLGTPRLVIDSAGAPLWRWDSDPFGTTAPNEDPAGTGTPYVLNLRFPGQYFDAETGLSYNYMRMYDPGSGRYLESDPVGLAGGINTYLYALTNPIQYTDPTGQVVPAVAACVTNPACAALVVATGAAIAHGARGAWGAASAQGNNSKTDVSESTATPPCDPADPCGPDSREQAMIKAYNFAGIPLDGGECSPIPFSDYNNKGRNYALVR